MARFNRRTAIFITLLCIVVLLITLTVVAFLPARSVSPADLFRRVVMRPIPGSVQAIRADICYESSLRDHLTGWREHTYLLRFAIGKEDLSKILAAEPFTELGHVEYTLKNLFYGPSATLFSNFQLYERDAPEPDWLDLEQWQDARVWIVEEEVRDSWYKARVLLYREPVGHAYFIEREMTGTWGGGLLSVTDPRFEAETRQGMEEHMQNLPESSRKYMEEARRADQELRERSREWVRQIEEARRNGTYDEANAPPIP